MSNKRTPGAVASITLYALLTAVTALSLDIILPAYSLIGYELGVTGAGLQHNLLVFVAGMLVGELVSGGLADRYGRRPVLALSAAVFIGGTLVCVFAPTYTWLLVGRLLQGMGAAGQKICTRAIIRDRYSGAAMASVMSYVLVVLVALPFIAPMLGATFTGMLGWRSIFVFLGFYACAALVWFWMWHPETLPQGSLANLHFSTALRAFFRQKRSLLLTIMAGLLFGVHLGFISLSPLLFADLFAVQDRFPFYFGCVACAFGIALLFNARYVVYWGMEKMIFIGLTVIVAVQIFFLIALIYTETVPFTVFLAHTFLLLFSLGLIFGNLTTLILQPLGRMAGVGSALSSALSSAVALVVSFAMGFIYEGKLDQFVFPCTFTVLAATAIFVLSTRSQLRGEVGHLVHTDNDVSAPKQSGTTASGCDSNE